MSKKAIGISIIVVCLIVLIWIVYPKDVGGPLCGPVCPSLGLHYYERTCFGIKTRDTSMTDSYADACYGLAVGQKRCFGVPFANYSSHTAIEDQLMDCDYPCNDELLQADCAHWYVNNLSFNSGQVFDCRYWGGKCQWKQLT